MVWIGGLAPLMEDERSLQPEKKWSWYDVDWTAFRKVWFKSAATKMISEIFQACHVP